MEDLRIIYRILKFLQLKSSFRRELFASIYFNGKIYDTRVLKPTKKGKRWYGIVDETHEEYAYPPELFEIVSKNGVKLNERIHAFW